MENKKFFNNEMIKSLILGAILGTAIISILLVLSALLLSLGVLPITAASICSTLSLSIGALLSSIFTLKNLKKNGLVTGLILGIVLFLIFTCISLIATLSAPTLLTLLKGIITMISASLGGIIGVNLAAKRKII